MGHAERDVDAIHQGHQPIGQTTRSHTCNMTIYTRVCKTSGIFEGRLWLACAPASPDTKGPPLITIGPYGQRITSAEYTTAPNNSLSFLPTIIYLCMCSLSKDLATSCTIPCDTLFYYLLYDLTYIIRNSTNINSNVCIRT